MDKIIERLIDFLPLWYVILLAIVIIGMRFYYKRFKPLENKTCEADCHNKNAAIDKLTASMEKLASGISEVKGDISVIKGILCVKFPDMKDMFSMKHSPRKLNPLGERVFKEIRGKQFLEDNKAFLFSKIDEMKPQTPLDVENAANAVCIVNTNNKIFNPIKDFVYNAPAIDVTDKDGNVTPYGVTLGDVCFILSLPLRDMYLEEHPGI